MRKNMKAAFEKFLSGGYYSTPNGSICVVSGEDKSTLYSYQMPIAYRVGKEIQVVGYENSPSKTTTSHIHQAKTLVSLRGVI